MQDSKEHVNPNGTAGGTGNDEILDEDSVKLASLGYKQEFKRIFNLITCFGLAASMISVLLGIIPLYTYSLQNGGPAVMFWSWIIIGFFTLILVASLAEICSAYPTMGALYYWAFKLGGTTWGPYSSWMAAWTNLLGQVAGVASGGYSGAELIGEMILTNTGHSITASETLGLYAVTLTAAGIINTFAETLLTSMCNISVAWHLIGSIVIVITMLANTDHFNSASNVFINFNNGSGFSSAAYVAIIGCLSACSTFTGYDTAAHVAEETRSSTSIAPKAMLFSVVNCLILGLFFIIGMNFCIQDLEYLYSPDNPASAYTSLWQQTVGKKVTIFFQFITFVGIECSNCANLTSAARMVYSFSRDGKFLVNITYQQSCVFLYH